MYVWGGFARLPACNDVYMGMGWHGKINFQIHDMKSLVGQKKNIQRL